MNTKSISTTNQILNIEHPLTMKATTPNFKSISFTSHLAKSRITISNQSRTYRTRVNAQIHAFYAPTESTETLYDMLGITESVNPSDIKKAYKQMARKYHPDVSPPDRLDEYTNKFIMLHDAYETLSNPQTRALYDKILVGGFSFGSKTSRNNCNKGMCETEEWKTKWESQLDQLKRGNVKKGNMSWAARMRHQRQ